MVNNDSSIILKEWWTILKEFAFPAKNEWQDIIEDDELDKYDIPITDFVGAIENGSLTASTIASLEALDLMLNGMEDAIEIYKDTQEATTGFLRSMVSRIKDIDDIETRIKKARKIYNNFYDRLPNLKRLNPFNNIVEPKDNQSEKEYVLLVLNKAYQNFISNPSDETLRNFIFITDFGVSSSKKLSPQHDTLETKSFERKWLRPDPLRKAIKNRDEEAENKAYSSIWTTADQSLVDRVRNILEIKQKAKRPSSPTSMTDAVNISSGVARPEEEELKQLIIGELAEDALLNFRNWQTLEAILKYLIKDDSLTADHPLYLWKNNPRALEFLMSIYRDPRMAHKQVRQFTMGLRGTGLIRGGQTKRAWATNKINEFTSSRKNPSIWGEELMTQQKYDEKFNQLKALISKKSGLQEYENLSDKENLNTNDTNKLNSLKEKYANTFELSVREANTLTNLETEVRAETSKRRKAATKGMKLTSSEYAEEYRNFNTTYSKLFERFKGQKISTEELHEAMKEEGQPIAMNLLEDLSGSSEDFPVDDFVNNIENDLVENLAREMILTFARTNSKQEYIRHMSDFFEPEGEEDYVGDISAFASTDPDAFPKAFATWLTIYEKILSKGKGERNKLSKAIIEDFPKNVEKESTGRRLKRRSALLNNLDSGEKESLANTLPNIEAAITQIETAFSAEVNGIREALQNIVRETLNSIAGNISGEGIGYTQGVRIKAGKTRQGAAKRKNTTVREALISHKYLIPEGEE